MDVETLDIADSVKERTRALLSSCVIKEGYFKRNVFPSLQWYSGKPQRYSTRNSVVCCYDIEIRWWLRIAVRSRKFRDFTQTGRMDGNGRTQATIFSCN